MRTATAAYSAMFYSNVILSFDVCLKFFILITFFAFDREVWSP